METKQCGTCKEWKTIDNYVRCKSGVNKGYLKSICNLCKNEYHKKWYKKQLYPAGQSPSSISVRKAFIIRPWLRHLYYARTACTSKTGSYYIRKIKCFLDEIDVHHLWFRDRAWELERPSVDRVNGQGNYELSNCRFIEFRDNCKRQSKHPKRFVLSRRRKIKQYDKDGQFIKGWMGIKATAKTLKISETSLCNCLKGRSQTCGGYLWEYAN